MRIPDPKANTTTEAYLAYKAGYLEESELKPVLYEPYLHFDAWLAYWAGLTTDYPHGIGKNLASETQKYSDNAYRIYFADQKTMSKTFTVSFTCPAVSGSSAGILVYYNSSANTGTLMSVNLSEGNKISFTITLNDGQWNNLRNGEGGFIQMYRTGAWATSPSSLDDAQIEEGSTATPYEPYTKIPEMLTDEEALVAYLSGVTDTYPEEIKDPYDVRIVGYLKYLVSARWGRPEYPVNNEEFYLSTMKPPVVPSGDTPSSDIEMDDTAEAPFIDLKMYGDTSQQTYSGKNLLLPNPRSSASNGITASYDATTGVITLSGTATANWSNAFIDVPVNLPAGTYTFSATTESGIGRNIIFFNGTTNILQKVLSATATSAECVVPQAITSLRLWLSPTNGTNYTGKTFKAQLEIGSQATSFEPYVGGIPAPNPDFPQNVHTVSGRQLVNVHGKNLANLGIDSYTTSGVQITNNGNQTLTFKGKATSTIWPAIMEPRVPVEVGKTYVMSIPEPVNVSLNFRTNLRNEALMQIPAGSTVSNSWSPSEDDEGWAFFTISSGTSVDFTTGVQIEEGSTPTDYQPYHGGPNEINLGKNLFDKNNYTYLDGYFENRGKIVTTSAGRNVVVYLPCKPSTMYAFSSQEGTGLNSRTISTTAQLPANGVQTSQLGATVGLGGLTHTTASDAAYIVIRFQSPLGTTFSDIADAVFANFQIEVGDTATPFAPYFEPIELCKIGDYQDYIYKSGDDWYIHKATGKAIFNGTEEGWSNDTSGSYLRVFHSLENVLSAAGRVADGYSNYFIPSTTNAYGIYLRNQNHVYFYPQSSINTLADFKTWLSTHNTNLYYPLATTTDTKITNLELISQLDALMECGSCDGKTFIKVTGDSPNLPAGLIVEAAKYA